MVLHYLQHVTAASKLTRWKMMYMYSLVPRDPCCTISAPEVVNEFTLSSVSQNTQFGSLQLSKSFDNIHLGLSLSYQMYLIC